jgi:hypothetical protein
MISGIDADPYAPRSVRIAVGASSWSVVMFMVSSKMSDGNPPDI